MTDQPTRSPCPHCGSTNDECDWFDYNDDEEDDVAPCGTHRSDEGDWL